MNTQFIIENKFPYLIINEFKALPLFSKDIVLIQMVAK